MATARSFPFVPYRHGGSHAQTLWFCCGVLIADLSPGADWWEISPPSGLRLVFLTVGRKAALSEMLSPRLAEGFLAITSFRIEAVYFLRHVHWVCKHWSCKTSLDKSSQCLPMFPPKEHIFIGYSKRLSHLMLYGVPCFTT